jgi:3D (Asp-Asp-Asp) domain-containing protein
MKLKTLAITLTILILAIIPGWYLIIADKNDNATPQYKWKAIRARVTHYSPHEKAEKIWKGKTSLNESAHNEKGIAVDPKLIPYGSMVYIPSVGVRVADDTGGRCKKHGKKGEILIDVRWTNKTTKELKELGAEWQTVYVLEKVDLKED